jgi:hypothetical protein
MTVFSGQMEKAGHFAHPTASAMGQSVMTDPWMVKKSRAYADVAGRSFPVFRDQAFGDPVLMGGTITGAACDRLIDR